MPQPFSLVIVTSAGDWRGSGVSFVKIARALAERGHDVRVVTASAQVGARFSAEGVSATDLHLPHTGIREVLRLTRVLRMCRADAIMADTPRDLRLSVLAGMLSRRPVVYRYNVNHRRPRRDVTDRLFAKRVRATVYLSDFIEADARAYDGVTGGESVRIPNGFDTQVYAPDPLGGSAFRARFGLDSAEAVVMSAGKLVPGKRIDRAIHALARVRSQRPLVYVLCGEGPEVHELHRLARSEGVRVVFTGLIDQETLREAYNAADLVLHTSCETFGNVIGEAMSCGRPVVCIREGAAPEVVGDDGVAGVVVTPDDSDALSAAIGRLLNDPEHSKRVGIAARCRIEKVFPIDRMIAGYEELFARLLVKR